MGMSMAKNLKILSSVVLCFSASQSFSFELDDGHVLLQGGGYFSTQGKAQNIYIQTLLGDRFNVTKSSDSNGLFGIGYLLDGPDYHSIGISYGLDLFYMPATTVQGTITQEFLYTNLAYKYGVRHIPLYAVVKGDVNRFSDKYALTIEGGIGPNFINTTGYNDWSIDGGETYPDHAFLSHSSVTFSATAGAGIKMRNVVGNVAAEVGYRFYYLGNAALERRTSQLINTLKTGDNYAQAVVVTLTL